MHFPHITTLALISLGTLLSSCDDNSPGDPHSENEKGESPSNRIDIPASVRNNLGITFAKVERRAVADTLRVPGAFELEPLAKHEYRLLLPAQVRFALKQFDEVEPGTLLYRFQSPQWGEIQSRINLAAANHRQAKAEYESAQKRLDALIKADFKSAELEAKAASLKADVSSHQAELNAALTTAAHILNTYRDPEKAALTPDDLLSETEHEGRKLPYHQSINWIEARAIEPGVVQSLAITDGSYTDATTLVLTTVDPERIRFRALGLQSDLSRFQQAPAARIVPHQGKGVDINQSLPAQLTIGLDANPTHRTITLFATPEQCLPWARPGVAAMLEVVTDTTAGPALAIPRSAVVKDGIVHVFFKRDPMDPNKAIRVEADLGIDDGRWVEIQSGLGPNDEVVLDGAYELKLASSQSGTSQEGGHFHADGTYHAEDH